MGVTVANSARFMSRRAPMAESPYKKDLLRIALCVLMVLSISRIHQRYPFLAVIRPGLTLTALALLAAFLDPKKLADFSWVKRWPAKVLIGLTICTLGSIVFGISQGAAFFTFSDVVWKVFVGCFLLMAAIRSAQDLRVFIWAYVIGTGILAFMATFVFQMVAEHNGVTRLSNLDTWDANDVCVLMEIGLPLCMLLLHTSRATLAKLTAGMIAVGCAVVIARSGSRGGFLGLGAVMVAYLLSMKGAAKIRGLAIAGVVGIALAISAPPGYWKQMATIGSAKEDYNWDATQGRRQLTIRGFGYMMQYPVFGLGVGNFGRAEGTISQFAGQRGNRWSAAHNSYIQAGSELGVAGFVLFLSMAVGPIVAVWRWRRRIPAAWAHGNAEEKFLHHATIYMPIAAVGFTVPAYFVSFAFTDPPYILLALTSGLIASIELRLRSGPSAAPRLAGAATDRRRIARPDGRHIASWASAGGPSHGLTPDSETPRS
jgi:O-antigen ligase